MPDKIKVIIAAHKPYWMPDDPLYLPVHVGAAGKDVIPGYQRDDEGDNISTKNPHYCELTGVYWAWKNLDADYVGLAHYRRHFRGKGPRNILTLEEASQLFSKAPVVVPKKTDYVISTVEQHYADTHSPEHLVAMRKAVATVSPEYLDAYDACMKLRVDVLRPPGGREEHRLHGHDTLPGTADWPAVGASARRVAAEEQRQLR